MFRITSGSWATAASAIDSCMSDRPCPVEPVADRVPVAAAPHAMPTASSSDSALTHEPPTSGRRLAMCSSTSVNGVIGYPEKNRHPAAIMASPMAADPSNNRAVTGRPPNPRPAPGPRRARRA